MRTITYMILCPLVELGGLVLPEGDSGSRLGAWDDPVFDCVYKEELVALPAGAVEVLVYPKS